MAGLGLQGAALAAGEPDVGPLCPDVVAKDVARCLALRVVSEPVLGGQPTAGTPSGYGPADLLDAYDLPANGGAGQTIAVVDAHDNPNALADLQVYRQQFGLAPLAEGQFTKVNQRGEQGDYPAADDGWAGEIALDLDMVSAIAPRADIILVEADSANVADLGASVNMAVQMGARFVSNSYGTSYTAEPGSGETTGEALWDDAYYKHPGVAVVASSGNSGYGVSYPSASPYVTSVGGTSLVRDSSARGWSETVWHNLYGGPGSGCSLYEPKPDFQLDAGCDHRALVDVSAVADPATGVAVYHTYGSGSGWAQYGGTGAAAPIIAATYALATTPEEGTFPNSYPYDSTSALNDITSGANGSCDPAYLCTAGGGYDGPTGLGTPAGVDAFVPPSYGDFAGTVTDASTGQPLAGAVVSAGDVRTTTDETGAYDLFLKWGDYDLSVAADGYATRTLPDMVLDAHETVLLNVALQPAQTQARTVSGTVTDASGHGWPLYARVTVDGESGAFTDPYTGRFSVSLPAGATHQLHVNAVYPGYRPTDRQLTLSTQSAGLHVRMKADPYDGPPPGYARRVSGTAETFDTTVVPPGWTVTNRTDGGGWVFADPHPRGNRTGGHGGFVVVDSDDLGDGARQDTVLTAPSVDFTGSQHPVVTFDTHYRGFSRQNGTVEYSTDGGASWATAWERTTGTASGRQVAPLPDAAGRSQVRVRFHFTASGARHWELDDVRLGNASLRKVRGGLVAGTVTDGNTGEGVIGATVTNTDDDAESVRTAGTTDDPGLGDGFYWTFSRGSGARAYAVTKGGYGSGALAVTVQPDHVVKGAVALPAGQVSLSKKHLRRTVRWQGHTFRWLRVTNTGTARAKVKIGERPRGSQVLTGHRAKVRRGKADVSWLSESRHTLRLAPGQSTVVRVRFDADEITQPGTLTASLTFSTDTPYRVAPVPVTLHVKPPRDLVRAEGRRTTT